MVLAQGGQQQQQQQQQQPVARSKPFKKNLGCRVCTSGAQSHNRQKIAIQPVATRIGNCAIWRIGGELTHLHQQQQQSDP